MSNKSHHEFGSRVLTQSQGSPVLLLLLLLLAVSLWSGCSTRKEVSSQALITPLPQASALQTFTGVMTDPQFRVVLRALASRELHLSEIPSSDTDELWVIARSSHPVLQEANDSPGSGSLMAVIEQKQVPMPLKHTDVKASVSGYIGTIQVVQQFQNPYSNKIEAVYVFPLPHNAAVNEFIMTIGERRIRGIIRERNEAEQIYAQAKAQGYVASLLTEERPNIFTQSVANIEPGKQIDVTIRYFHTLEYDDGWYEFVFPMVVGPRFNPPSATDGVGAVARGAGGSSGQKTEVQYLKPNERSGHDIALRLEVDAGMPVEGFRCLTHDVDYEAPSAERMAVTLRAHDSLPNRDFVFRYRVTGGKVKTDVITQRDERGQFFTLMLYPPQEVGSLARQPLELVFVLDCSGSMDGRPIRQAKAAVERGLQLLEPGDSFQIINFSTTASRLGPRPLEATRQNVRRGLDYLRSLKGDGGTMMIEGIKAALDFQHDPDRLRFVCFLTDGYIGDESEILRAIHERLGPSRIFSFGIGSSVNRYLLDHMAKTGRGAVAYVGSRDDAAAVMESFFERISHPALTDVTIDWGGMRVSEVYPRQVPDLFAGRPVILTGRYEGDAKGSVCVRGQAAGQPLEFTIDVASASADTAGSALAAVWARMKIADLAAQSVVTPGSELTGQIRQIALDYGLMSPFTAFVAVDSTQRTAGESATVPVAVPVPEGVNYDTTVNEGAAGSSGTGE